MTDDRDPGDLPRDLDQFTAEQLLSGEPVDREVGPLADLLAAAAATARADELAGEAAAVAAFRDAVGASRPATSAVRSTVTKALAIKVAVALTAVAGASLGAAAATGNLPGSGDPQIAAPPATSSRPTARSTAMTPVKPSESAGRSTKPGPSMAPTKPHPSKRVTPTPPPSPEIEGLCKAYIWARTAVERSGADGDNDRYSPTQPPERQDPGLDAERMLDLPAYEDLVRKAGGKSKVAGYCGTLLKTSKPRAPEGIAPSPQRSVHPSGRPTYGPTNSWPAASPTGSLTASPPPRGR